MISTLDRLNGQLSRSIHDDAATAYKLEQGSGAIVNVASIATRNLNRVPYGAAKCAVNALTTCLALENAGRGTRINATVPSGTEAPPRRLPRNTQPRSELEKVRYPQIIDQMIDSTLMTPYGTIDEQSGAILFFAFDEASCITLPMGGGDLD
jgi:dihydroxycyclohexadiene carboxylate dehydrogenase